MKQFMTSLAVCTATIITIFLSGCGHYSIVVANTDEPEIQKPLKVPDAEAYRPTPLPDRIILTWTGDPSRSQAVTWRTDTSVDRGLAEIAVATDNAGFTKTSRQLTAKTQLLETELSRAHYHTVEFHALSPRTKYAYRVGDGTNWTEWYHFSTASDQPEPFTFVYFGDAQNDIKPLWSRVIREAFTDAPKARFLLHAGDLINRQVNDNEWGDWHLAGGWLNAMTPSVVTPGNHEYEFVGETRIPNLSRHWRPQFALPENGPPELLETVYFVDFQGTRIISLNSNEQIDAQANWLQSVLSQRPDSIHWTVITFHHPIYSSAKNRDNKDMRDKWQPLFDKFKVDLVLQGHDHTYARSKLINSTTGIATKGESGTVYVVSVSGPKMYDVGKPVREEFQRIAEDTQLFQIITIDGSELRYQARTATGHPYDGFTLRKTPGQPTDLIEQIPDTPARVRPEE
jgi:hypothetical protein